MHLHFILHTNKSPYNSVPTIGGRLVLAASAPQWSKGSQFQNQYQYEI
jgi:hypothetical protein